MASALVFALSLAGFGLLVFGERMGLPAALAASGVMGVVLAATAALALVSATSRQPRHLLGSERGAATCLAALAALTAAFAAPLAVELGPERIGAVVSLAAGVIAALVISPFNPWREPPPLHVPGEPVLPGAAATSGADDTRGALPLFRLAIAAVALVLVVRFFPLGIERIAEAGGWDRDRVFALGLGGVALLVLLGGLSALGRASLVLAALVLMLGILPFVAGWVHEATMRLDLSAGTLSSILGAGIGGGAFRLPEGIRPVWPAVILGFALGMMLLQPAAAVAHRPRRIAAILAGLGFAGLMAFVAARQSEALSALTARGFAGLPPAQWPVFVFDDSLRGWLSACGVPPEDAGAAARACSAPTPRQPLPAGAVTFSPGLGPAALAMAQGWPIILGFIWGLLVPLVEIAALGFLLHAAATGIAEGLFHRVVHPRALRSWRLAVSRLTLLGLVAGIALLWRHDLRLEAPAFRWLMLGLAMTALGAMVGYRLIRLVRRLRGWRAARVTAEPVPVEASS